MKKLISIIILSFCILNIGFIFIGCENPTSGNPSGDNPTIVDPPEDNPPVVDPPEDNPPVVDPPEDNPPVVDPPEVNPPVVNPEPFVAVTSITGIPTAGLTNEDIHLTGTVNPSNATNQTITWSIKSQSGTNSTLSGSVLSTGSTAGTLTITATVINGATATTPYTQDFNITVNAFTGSTHTVTFKLNGGNINGNTADVVHTVNEGSDAIAPDNITRTGYNLTGWSGTFTNVTSNLTVTAQWTAITYTITYNETYSLTNTNPTTYTIESAAITFSALTGTRTGYTFNGWDITSIPTGSTGNKTITAKWNANVYTISYMDVGNTAFSGTHGANHPTSHTYGTTTTLVNPTKSNYTFGGWFTNSAGTGSAVTSLSATGYTANITLYAKWTAIPQYTVTFDLQGGNISGSTTNPTQTVNQGSTISSLPNPTRTNYTFGGWYTATNGGGTQFTTSTIVNSTLTVYAKWTAVSGLMYIGEYWPEGSDTNSAIWTPMNANHLKDLLNGEVTTSQLYPFIDGYMVYSPSSDGKGVIYSMNTQTDSKKTPITVTGMGYVFIVTQNRIKDIKVGSVSDFGSFTEVQIVLGSNSYYLYYMKSPTSNSFNWNVEYY